MINLTDYGFMQNMTYSIEEGIPARVTAVHRERYELFCDNGECFGRLKTGVYYSDEPEKFPTAGDFVLIDYNPLGDSRITKTLPRKSCFSRKEAGPVPREQAVAANFDYVFIVQSLNKDFNVKRLERYLTASWESGGIPVVVLTKADLSGDVSEFVAEAEKGAPGVDIHAVSAHTGYGMEALDRYMVPGKTVVLLGSSGVGKSSLLNALLGDSFMEVRSIRDDDEKGRHTTTYRQLVMLPSKAMIIDTPGMRELGMGVIDEGFSGAFSDVEKYIGKCKFTDCAHENEPGCAVLEAIERGELSVERWESYQALMREARFFENKVAYGWERTKKRKEIAKFHKQIRKNGGYKK